MPTIIIKANINQTTEVLIRDLGIIIPASGTEQGSETFTDQRNIDRIRNSKDVRTLTTDDAYGTDGSTLILNDGTQDIDQDEVDDFLGSIGPTGPTGSAYP